MDILAVLAEEKIREAMRRGEFANLAGKGQPLQVDDLSHVPEQLRAGYTILKNAGVLPEEMQLKNVAVAIRPKPDSGRGGFRQQKLILQQELPYSCRIG